MNVPYKLRYVNQLVGAFILLTAAALLIVAVVAVRRQAIFVPEYRIYAYLPEAILDGVREGTEVIVLGRVAGNVENLAYVDPREDGSNVQLTLAIKETFQHEIFTDSVANLRRKLAGAGEAYLEISRGPRHREVLSPSGTLQMFAEAEPTSELKRLAGMIDDVRGYFENTQNSMIDAFSKVQELAEDVQHTNRRLQTVVDDVQDFSPRLSPLAEKTDQVLSDFKEFSPKLKSLADQAETVIGDLQAFSPRLDPLADKADEFFKTSNEVAENLRRETEDLRGSGESLHDGIEGAQQVIDGLRHHWLLRRYIDTSGGDVTISPSEIGQGPAWP